MTTRHLSVWSAFRVDTGKLLGDATSLLKGFIGLADTTARPPCPGSAQLAVDHTAKILSPAPPGQAPVITPGGDAVQFSVPSGDSGVASTSPSSEAYLIDAFLYGAQTLAMTLDDIPGAPKANPSATAKAISLAFRSRDCLTQIDALAHGDVSTAYVAGELFRSDVELAVGCLGGQWKQVYGISGFIGQFVVSVLLWLADGIKLVLTGLRAAIDSAISWRTYRIAVSQSGLRRQPALRTCRLGRPARSEPRPGQR